jgi:hypothetical protein
MNEDSWRMKHRSTIFEQQSVSNRSMVSGTDKKRQKQKDGHIRVPDT